MIDFLSSWAKNLGLVIVVVSILEMLLPNNKTKKYIRMVMGIFIIFNIISPAIENKNLLDVNQINLESYTTNQVSSEVNQTSMNERIEDLYIEQLEKDITKKIKEKGYEVINCKVNAQIADNEEDTKITKIKLKIKQGENSNKEESSDDVENKIVSKIQKIKTINTTIEKEEKMNEDNKEKDENVSKAEIQNIKKFLIEEYEVSEKCLEIN